MPTASWPALLATRLENEHVVLRPITPDDRDPLRAIALDPAIWRYFVVMIRTPAEFDAFFDAGLADQRAGRRGVVDGLLGPGPTASLAFKSSG